MPSKRNLTPPTETTPSTTPIEAAPKRTRTARKTAEPSPAPTAEPIATKARSRAKASPPVTPVPKPPVEKPRPNLRRSTKPAPVAEVVAPEPEPVAAVAEAPRPRPERKASRSKPTAKASPTVSQPIEDTDGILLSWRPLSKPAPAPVEPPAEPKSRRRAEKSSPKPKVIESPITAEDGELVILEWRTLSGERPAPEPSEAPKRERTRTPRREPRERPAETPAEPLPTVEAPKVKALIPIPDDAPQVVLRDGIPTLVRHGRVYPPIMFYGRPADERRTDTVMAELKMAADADIHLHALCIDLEVNTAAVADTAARCEKLLKRALEIDPMAQVLFKINFVPPHGWEEKFPNARFRGANGVIAEPSICDHEYWSVAAQCLTDWVERLCKLPERKHLLGVHLDRGEWFISDQTGYDESKAAQEEFRNWARARYARDEVTFRASWFDGSAQFDTIQIPKYRPAGEAGEKFIRSSRRQRRYVDYHMFLSDTTVHRIGELAYAAKEASQGYLLVGVSYGYTFEWLHPSSGHLALGKLLRTPEVDFIAGPPSYRTREPGGSAGFPSAVDSIALNGKLYLSEEDFKTSLSMGHEPDDFNPPLRTPQALENIHWRGTGAALAHASGVSWMDLWGNGWLRTPSVWERAGTVRTALIDRMEAPMIDPEVAVFVDERALAYIVDEDAFQLLVQNVRESVLRAGVSVGFYLLSDLAHREKFPDSKLYLFLNAWDIRPDLRAAIKSRLQCDGKVLFWLYSAGLFDAGRDSLERAREVTGIALKPQPFHSRSGTTILNKRHLLTEAFPDRTVIGNRQLEPSYFAIPEGATVLGEYTQTGLPSFVVKEFRDGPPNTHWTSVFLGEPQVNPALIRALAQMAGVHIWNFQDDVVHVRPPFCTVHSTGSGSRTIALPAQYSAFNLGTNEWMGDGGNVRTHMPDGSTNVFLVGPREDLVHFLDLDPSAALRMDTLPPREANVRVDASNFDVPMMKLDEWMEGESSDDVATDEWFLRPPTITEEPAQATEERVGQRRRKRHGRDRTEVPNATGSIEIAEDDLEMSVVFRKRE